MIAELRKWRYPEAEIAKAEAELAAKSVPDVFEVYAPNAAAVRLFGRMRSQWREVSLSTWDRAQVIRTGLIYEAIEPTARLARIELGGDDFDRLQVMEAEALAAWHEERRRRS